MIHSAFVWVSNMIFQGHLKLYDWLDLLNQRTVSLCHCAFTEIHSYYLSSCFLNHIVKNQTHAE